MLHLATDGKQYYVIKCEFAIATPIVEGIPFKPFAMNCKQSHRGDYMWHLFKILSEKNFEGLLKWMRYIPWEKIICDMEWVFDRMFFTQLRDIVFNPHFRLATWEWTPSKITSRRACPNCNAKCNAAIYCNYVKCSKCNNNWCQECYLILYDRDHHYSKDGCLLFPLEEPVSIPNQRLHRFLEFESYCNVLYRINHTLSIGRRINIMQFQGENGRIYNVHLPSIQHIVFVDANLEGDNIWDCLAFRDWSVNELQYKINQLGFVIDPPPAIVIPIIPTPIRAQQCDQCNVHTIDIVLCDNKKKPKHLWHGYCPDCISKNQKAICLASNCNATLDITGISCTCMICEEWTSQIRTCEVGKHIVCTDCLAHWVKTKPFQQATNCPGPACNYSIDIHTLPGISQEWYDGLASSLFGNQLKTCPCGARYVQDDNKQHDYFDCWKCKRCVCMQCLKYWDDSHVCEIVSDMVEIISEFQLPLTQCPTCHMIMEIDISFCNKLTCLSCSRKGRTLYFCAICKDTFHSDASAYGHFCRSFATDPIACGRAHCKHCAIWPTKDAANRADPHFLNQYPQFRMGVADQLDYILNGELIKI